MPVCAAGGEPPFRLAAGHQGPQPSDWTLQRFCGYFSDEASLHIFSQCAERRLYVRVVSEEQHVYRDLFRFEPV